MDALALRDAIAVGEIDPNDVAARARERARADKLNSFVHVAAGEPVPASGSLRGVPIAIKDVFVDGDRHPTCGSRVHASWLRGTAEILTRVRDAGAVVVGYTNLHEWGVGTTSSVTATGPILNPRDPSLAAGGSSGGSAAAVASGVVPLAVGTDAGGSIRVPSAYCGVVGLKPTYGRVPMAGFAGEDDPVDHCGPIARTVADAAALFAVLAGEAVEPVDTATLRLGVAEPHFFDDVVPEVAGGVREAITVLEGLTSMVTSVAVAGAELAGPASALFLPPYTARALARDMAERPESFQPETMNVLLLGASVDEDQLAQGEAIRAQITQGWASVFAEVDVVVTPTVACLPPASDDPVVALPSGTIHVDLTNIAMNAPMNMAGVPALSLPCARLESGATVSMTLTAARGNDAAVLALGRAFEETTGGAFVSAL